MKYIQGSLTFYITNVCNLNCQDCSYLNNYALKGHQLWKDNELSCLAWAEKIDPALILILGGEPFANPDFLQWVNGLADIFVDSEIRIITNGTMFQRWPTLYDEILKYNGRVSISVSGHNEHTRDELINNIKNFLKGNITASTNNKTFRSWIWKKMYSNVKDVTWPECTSVEEYERLPSWIRNEIEQIHNINIYDYIIKDEPSEDFISFVDENRIRVAWAQWDVFFTSAIKFDPEQQVMTLYDSDPDKAVASCGLCAQIKDGKLYKCQVLSNLPELINQKFPLQISDQDRELILSYQPADPTWDEYKLEEFVKELDQGKSIPQCKICPDTRTPIKIYAGNKKPKVVKI